MGWQQDFFINDALLPGIIRLLMVIVAEQVFSRAIRCGGKNGLPGGAFDDAGVKMVQGDQGSSPSGGRGCAS